MGFLALYSIFFILTSLTLSSWHGEVISRDWFSTLLVITIIYTLGLLWLDVALEDKEREKTEQAGESIKQRKVDGWEAVFAKHEGMMKQLATLRSDEKMRLLYPELENANSPLAKTIEKEQRLAVSLRPAVPTDQEPVENSAYYRAVERLESAIREFTAGARSVGWDNLTPGERLQRSIALEGYYKKQEARDEPLRSEVLDLVM